MVSRWWDYFVPFSTLLRCVLPRINTLEELYKTVKTWCLVGEFRGRHRKLPMTAHRIPGEKNCMLPFLYIYLVTLFRFLRIEKNFSNDSSFIYWSYWFINADVEGHCSRDREAESETYGLFFSCRIVTMLQITFTNQDFTTRKKKHLCNLFLVVPWPECWIISRIERGTTKKKKKGKDLIVPLPNFVCTLEDKRSAMM